MTPEPQPISQPQRIDRYVGQYAARAVDMVASEIRALFAVAARPEIVSLAGGSPNVSALPLDAVGAMIGQLIASQGATALQYCTAQGDAGLRERICDVMALEQIRAHPDEIVVTVGSQQALDLLTRIFIDPGDVILVEAPSYVGALGAFASYQAECGARGDGRGRAHPRGPRRGHQAHGRRRTPGQVPLHRAELPEPSRGHPGRRAAAPHPGHLPPRRACSSSRTTPMACSASTASRCARCAPTTRTGSSTSARSPRPSPRACGWAGRSRRRPSGRS